MPGTQLIELNARPDLGTTLCHQRLHALPSEKNASALVSADTLLRADRQTEATHVAIAEPPLPIPIGTAGLNVQSGFAPLFVMKLHSGESLDRASVHTLLAITTLIINPLP